MVCTAGHGLQACGLDSACRFFCFRPSWSLPPGASPPVPQGLTVLPMPCLLFPCCTTHHSCHCSRVMCASWCRAGRVPRKETVPCLRGPLPALLPLRAWPRVWGPLTRTAAGCHMQPAHPSRRAATRRAQAKGREACMAAVQEGCMVVQTDSGMGAGQGGGGVVSHWWGCCDCQ